MKKFLFFVAAALLSIASASAQLGVFNHLGVSAGVGTTGISLEAATPITDFIQLRAGVHFMPGFSYTTSVDAEATVAGQTEPFDVDVKGSLKRTQGSVIFNVYPFGKMTKFFVAGGLFFGGQDLITVTGHSARALELMHQHNSLNGGVNIGDYQLPFDKNGDVKGSLRQKSVRPYVALGFGRPVPGRLLNFMFELGVQFSGKMHVYDLVSKEEVNYKEYLDNDDDFQKIMDNLKVYPVLKFTLSGKIF